ncbi:hypothetical protein T4A_7904 [Trichinella pseudospiralis]|uniref:Uncharacterized protein n=1 Tax=Trichinella pseudospiralis TaxID=6337 RepID=A0A0V1FJ94_TRIPS|nr:hypothetical protein T4A_7904 [Trichinella pseudospiralis]KRY86046.1 hypothetical protein T4D_11764 [Trichinella pseudospiralis]
MKQTVDAWRQLEKQQTTWHLANEQADLSTRTGDMLSKKSNLVKSVKMMAWKMPRSRATERNRETALNSFNTD